MTDIVDKVEILRLLRARKVAKDGIARQPRKHEREAAVLIEEQHAEILALRAQVAATQAECLEQARLNGMGSEREARLQAQVAELTRERDEARVALARYASLYGVKQPQSSGIAVGTGGAMLYNAQAIAAGEHRP